MIKGIYIFAVSLMCFFLSNSLFSQIHNFKITGTVVENQGQQPIEFATVLVKHTQSQQVLTGTTTLSDGSFRVLSNTDSIYLEISFIGFITKSIDNFQVIDGSIDLGMIVLLEDKEILEGVVVEAEKSKTEFRLDKRVFNVGQDLSSAGVSALELLNNVPSVKVDIEGQISLRGSNGVQILINGKPSVLANEEGNALGTITAEMIDRVEVITNPSAKYDAEGTSGIINIVLKKEERKGLNGSISLNTGIPHNHSIGLSLNRRTEKFNFFGQLGAGYRELPRNEENINRDLENGTTILSDGRYYRNETFFNIILGTDYHINRYNVLTFSGNFAYEIEDQPSQTNFTLLDNNNNTTSEWHRSETAGAMNPKWQYEFQYKKDFKNHEDHDLLFSALSSFFSKDLASDFKNVAISEDLTDTYQQTESTFGESKYTFQIDYIRPFSKKFKLETGGQYVIQDVKNDYSVSNLVDGQWIDDTDLTNVFEYDQRVLGLYATTAYEGDKWGIKIGLRAENTNLNTLLASTNERNSQYYTNLFPSFHTSYKISNKVSLQAGYSRRIFRPRLWHLAPFIDIRNNFNIQNGSPVLQPEFTDSYEINSIYFFEKLSLNLGIYHLYTMGVIEWVSTFENNVSITKPINVGTNRSTGVELNAKYTPAKWLTISGEFDYDYFNQKGVFEGTSFDFLANSWTSELNMKFKLPASIDFEMTGNYWSSYQTVQGKVGDNFFIDLGLRKKIIKGKIVVNFSVRDVFASRHRETEVLQDDFYIYSFRNSGRFITLGLSYGFGKGEAMQYSGGRRR